MGRFSTLINKGDNSMVQTFSEVVDVSNKDILSYVANSNFQMTNSTRIIYQSSQLSFRAISYVLYGVHIGNHSRSMSSCNVLFKITCDESYPVWRGVVILYDEIITQGKEEYGF